MSPLLLPLMNSKPLNPNADSWFPDAKKSCVSHHHDEIYNPTSAAVSVQVPLPAAALYQEPFPFPPPFHQFHPQVPVPFESAVSLGYAIYYTFSPESKEILSLPRKPKFLRNKHAPPRLRRKYFVEEDFREKKISSSPPSPATKKIWKPKNEEIIISTAESPVSNKITTVMLKNVPNQYR